jgi:hypothetical protein
MATDSSESITALQCEFTTTSDKIRVSTGQQEIFEAELVHIRARRIDNDLDLTKINTEHISKEEIASAQGQVRSALSLPNNDLKGLSLSGGGIRSAAFCMGVVQALERAKLLKSVDYLSTVSGGGYFGACLSASLKAGNGAFAFSDGVGTSQDISDTPMVAHLRDKANYLLPRGLADVLTTCAIILRGLVCSALLILPYLLLGAAAAVFYNPTVDDLAANGPNFFKLEKPSSDDLAAKGLSFFDSKNPMMGVSYPVTLLTGIFLVLVFFFWSLARSTWNKAGKSDLESLWRPTAIFLLLLFVGAFIFEAGTHVLYTIFVPNAPGGGLQSGSGDTLVTFAKLLTGAVPVLLFVVTQFKEQLAKAASEEAGFFSQLLKKYGSRLTLYGASALLPALLLVIFLALVYWGTAAASPKGHYNHAPVALQALFDIVGERAHALLGICVQRESAVAYTLGGVVLLLLTSLIDANAYSLHRLYRDRLRDTFLTGPVSGTDKVNKLSGLTKDGMKGPYPLFNTAINIHGSDAVNQRGRNADFFLFSPEYIGSPATGYVKTTGMETADPFLDLAAVMAISGAAASSNMGAHTVRPLTFTLAALNIRLGYWLPNPRKVGGGKVKSAILFLAREMTSGLTEELDKVYLTDGGHIENLGIYELLRRRCKLIIAVDAEADEGLRFGSLVTLQRHARIDLGIRISLPWGPVGTRSAATMAANRDPETRTPQLHEGPHAALGTISYDDGSIGYLLYIKSSLTGDENDYISDYARRNPAFPHETTGDQFFSEEQFEVYRALGFHCAHGVLSGRDGVAVEAGNAGTVALTEVNNLLDIQMRSVVF